MDFLKDLIKSSGNEYVNDSDEGKREALYYIDTGSYILNALISGSIFKGIPENRIVSYIGEPATGKTYFTLSAVKGFLNASPENVVVYIETEGSLKEGDDETDKTLSSFGIDRNRFKILPVITVQEFRTQVLKIIEKYRESKKQSKTSKYKLMICVDSLGNLSTTKEMSDSLEGKETQDMTRARLLKGVFRTITLQLSTLSIPMIITNHVYLQQGVMFPQQIPGGGNGPLYLCSIIVALSKRKEKDGTEVVGNIIHCKNFKNRLAKENKVIDTMIRYDTGLSRYYGMCDLAVESGIFKKIATRIELPDGTKVFEKRINSNPEQYFTEEILKKIDDYVQKAFVYGSVGNNVNEIEEGEEDNEE